jgi:hypothetical protein
MVFQVTSSVGWNNEEKPPIYIGKNPQFIEVICLYGNNYKGYPSMLWNKEGTPLAFQENLSVLSIWLFYQYHFFHICFFSISNQAVEVNTCRLVPDIYFNIRFSLVINRVFLYHAIQ